LKYAKGHLQSPVMNTESSDADPRRSQQDAGLPLKAPRLCLGFRPDALTGATSVFRKVIVWIAVQPPLPGLCRDNHRMSTGARMRRGVAVWRAVATQGRATRLTRPQMNPPGADLDTLIAFLAFRMGDSCDRTEMRTDWV
jgi:hypothetical protein